ncbi:hypothetical protein MGYG_05616 [Nannizzia gypsea CBS 118893]|uniref:Uncharacterized protein n=1 Tax=Arthroderma gypseum (strain ATCC MYA-4604 / CBS 118893) TaxID=535722 RepID=E4UWX9_ARTGP|nr:hypothetical protein MGYG_05616 [Nannizzia gypsea CBS 118893]EFR02618.1 hypothetical protein MGYG_05616 [Nannizzia gypsea CBS 118893]
MPCSVAVESSRKRREREEEDLDRDHSSKRRKGADPVTSTAYWDNLSKVWLTKDALEELDRRNKASGNVKNLQYFHHHRHRHRSRRPLTRQLQARLKCRGQTLVPDPLVNCKPEIQREIKRLSRKGGPDLSDLRNFPNPGIPYYQSMGANNSRRQKRRAGDPPDDSNTSSNKITRTTSSTAYNRNFEQKLIDYGVYPPEYREPGCPRPAKPDNWRELNERLVQPRASLSPSKFSEQEFEEFREADINAAKEKTIVRSAFPRIEGRIDDSRSVGGDYLFGNLAPLTDGTLAKAKPDHFFGAHPKKLDEEIREELNDYIIPSTQTSLPMLPNFFLETKGPDGSSAVVTKQACYHGALGARGMHRLQSYRQDKPVYDNKAYTITSTYQSSQLKLYTTHLTGPREDDGPLEYIMTPLRSFAMTDNPETFRQGATVYRNARDWAKEQRDDMIKCANERYRQARSELPSASEREETAEATAIPENAGTPVTSDEADAAWSFTRPNDNDNIEDLQGSNIQRPN